MAKSMKNLLKLSLTARGLTSVRNQTLSMRLYQTSANHQTINEKVDTALSYSADKRLPFFVLPTSQLSVKIRKCDNISEILNLVQIEIETMDVTQLIKTLEKLRSLVKTEAEAKSISKKKEFAVLCNAFKRHIRELNDEQAIHVLKHLTYFAVPTTTVICQMLLQIVRLSVNSLALKQIVYLEVLLKRCDQTPLVQALTIALPIVFETHLKTEFCGENLESLVASLKMLQNSEQFRYAVPLILRAINKFESSNFTTRMATQTIFSLFEIRTDQNAVEILNKVQETLTNSANTIESKELPAIIYRIRRKLLDRHSSHPIFYNEAMLDALVTSLISKDMGFSAAINVLKNLNAIMHVSVPLLDYLAAKCYENKNLLRDAHPVEATSFINGLSLADYKPVFWDTIKDALLHEKILDHHLEKITLIGLRLATLDVYWPKLFELVFLQPRFSDDYGKKTKLSFLAQTVKIFYPEYKGPWPSEELDNLIDAAPVIEKKEYPLKSALELALGGSQYVLTNLKTPSGYYIDHAIIMRKGGFPIAINHADGNPPQKITDLTTIPDRQAILFHYIPENDYPRNVQRPSGFWSLFIRVLEAQTNHSVIAISPKMWQKMSQAERARYISQSIRLKSEEFTTCINL